MPNWTSCHGERLFYYTLPSPKGPISATMAPPRVSLLSHIRPCVSRAPHIAQSSPSLLQASFKLPVARVPFRTFTTTQTHLDWLTPVRKPNKRKDHKGRPRVCTGGSIRGTTVLWGDYGLRMRDHDRRISAHQLRNGEEVIRRRLRGMKYRLFTRITAHTAVYTKGNESRMGTGKGSFDHWAARVPVSRVIFEVTGDCHEQIIRDALRLAANKMPGRLIRYALRTADDAYV